jgi:hypothetical protein
MKRCEKALVGFNKRYSMMVLPCVVIVVIVELKAVKYGIMVRYMSSFYLFLVVFGAVSR